MGQPRSIPVLPLLDMTVRVISAALASAAVSSARFAKVNSPPV
jgi:hypothetical protein